MTCSYCGTHLPAGALFCGECGRSTRDRPAAAATASAPVAPPLVVEAELVAPVHVPSVIPDDFLTDIPIDYDRPPETVSVPEPEPEPEPAFEPEPEPPFDDYPEEYREPFADLIPERVEGSWCAQCGALLAESEIFCGECGFVRSSAQPARDTAIIEPLPWDMDAAEDVPEAPVVPPAPAVVPPAAAVLPPPAVVPPAPLPTAEAHSHALGQLDDDMEQTRIVAPGAAGDRFILQFSTGESVSVTGSGLLGRNPLAEPGEYFDALVAISDPGKSVSKTHLEFGQEGGAFWISDRFSGNGTLFREPERTARRCEPGKRYRIARGTRVEIGEQFFIVS